MSDANSSIINGGCFCGAARYQVTGRPILSAYCHCTLCQRLNASAFILSVHFSSTNFSWTHDEPHLNSIESYSVSTKPWKIRWRCKNCGCCIASNNLQNNKWSVYGGQFDRDENGKIIGWETIKPTAHIFYETKMIDIQDDLGKWAGYEGVSERLA
ncbi:hypothetical protein JR316_0000506 [Psilocybe cubensis]|uniref:Uncharacterized protein n=1 Tax=Psilocybe cubensis TaxID=181762 RepID=A0ACB8HET0_PSICU|nr:hypothetical protein JR316_0000506 [Psilocybe cubensis]KAH9486441.1 hypothetical protein JR316_0000506 [Psilocybe cubensis]